MSTALKNKVIIKNLPIHFTNEQDIIEHFSKQGEWPIISCRLQKKPDGQSRRFAYLIYQDKDNSGSIIPKIVQYFNGSYVHTSKIFMEIAKPREDPSLWTQQKAGKKQSTESGSQDGINAKVVSVAEQDYEEKKRKLMSLYDDENDPDLRAYLRTMKAQSQTKTWTNDDGLDDVINSSNSTNTVKNEEIKTIEEKSSTIAGKKEEPTTIITDNDIINRLKGDTVEKSHNESTFVPGEPLSYKKKKALETRQRLSSTVNWNTFYLNHDAVMECVSRQMGIKKIDLLNIDSSGKEDMAVRVALSETHILQQTKQYLLDEGLQLDNPLFNDSSKSLDRSKTTILVKNIPFNTEEEEIAALFTPFGVILRIILPPTRVICIVEFAEAADAKAAFSKLSYRRFKFLPLYLEWIPEGFMEQPRKSLEKSKANNFKVGGNSMSDPTVSSYLSKSSVRESLLSDTGSTSLSSTSTLFIKNINFASTESDLSKIFTKFPGFVQCSISYRKDLKKPGQLLSCGYGFAEFSSIQDAESALLALKNTILDGHILVIKFSEKSNNLPDNQEALGSTKLMIRNIPFEATSKDLRALFSPFGNIKRLKLPKKFDSSHRGFGFIEFSSHENAKIAMESVKHSHLYGRHLVLEWANPEDQYGSDHVLQELREKASNQMRLLSVKGPRKQGRIEMDEEDELDNFPPEASDDDE